MAYVRRSDSSMFDAGSKFLFQGFDACEYVRSLTEAATGKSLQEKRDKLRDMADKNSQALKANVYRNYDVYVGTSKEISKLESEMYTLGDLLNGQATMLKALESMTLLSTSQPRSMEVAASGASSAPNPEGAATPQQSCALICPSDLVDPWILDAPEDIDVFIAQRAFQNAVDLIERTTEALKTVDPPAPWTTEIAEAVADLRNLLADTLCAELTRTTLRHTALRTVVMLLLRLGKADSACRKYLSNRSQLLQNEYSKLKIEGATELFIHKLAQCFFGTLRATCLQFKNLFHTVSLSSTLIAWVCEELEKFCDIFSSQVLHLTTNSFQTVAECVRIVCMQCQQLENLGLDLLFMCWRLLRQGIMEAVDEAGRTWISLCAHHLVDEPWTPEHLKTRDARKHFTATISACEQDPSDYIDDDHSVLFRSTTQLVATTHDFVATAARLYNPIVHDAIMSRIKNLFKLYIAKYCEAFDGSDVFKTNVAFICDNLVGHIKVTLKPCLGNRTKEVDELATSLLATWTLAVDAFNTTHKPRAKRQSSDV